VRSCCCLPSAPFLCCPNREHPPSYANSVLQTLYFCSPFRDLVIQSTDISAPPLPAPVSRQTHPPQLAATPVPQRRKPERAKPVTDAPPPVTSPTPTIPSTPPTLFSALRSLYVYISRHPAEKATVAPRAFIDKLRDGNELFRGAMHQDAHEFLNYLLNKIVEEIQDDKHHRDKDVDDSNPTSEDCECSSHVQVCFADSLSVSPSATLTPNNVPTLAVQSDAFHQTGTLVHRLFEGTLTSETRCLTCETVSLSPLFNVPVSVKSFPGACARICTWRMSVR
jgi:ubiquitin carboxyl-terminal hydrolase 9/13